MRTRIGLKALGLSFVMLALVAASTPAVAQQYDVNLLNATDISFEKVQASSVDNPYWGRDLLGRDYFDPGALLTLSMSKGKYDLRFTDHQGSSCILHGVIVDRNSTVAVTNDWLQEYCTFRISRR